MNIRNSSPTIRKCNGKACAECAIVWRTATSISIWTSSGTRYGNPFPFLRSKSRKFDRIKAEGELRVRFFSNHTLPKPVMPHILQSLLTHDKAVLEATLGLDAGSARIEVQCLLQAVLRVNRAYLLTHPEQILDVGQQAHYAALFERRLSGEPLAYILGEREFFGLMFRATPATLIPRPDTELLVELALQRIPSPDLAATLSRE